MMNLTVLASNSVMLHNSEQCMLCNVTIICFLLAKPFKHVQDVFKTQLHFTSLMLLFQVQEKPRNHDGYGVFVVREAGVEPARPEWTLEPESSESANSTTRAYVGRSPERPVIISSFFGIVNHKFAPSRCFSGRRGTKGHLGKRKC